MATFRSALRSYGVAVRRMELEEKRRARDAAKRFKEQQKMQAIDDARDAVEQWEDYVELLQTMHKLCTDPVDWQEFLDTPTPEVPIHVSLHTAIVQYNIVNF